MSETSIEPQSVAADKEPEAERPIVIETWRVLKRDEGTIPQVKKWIEEDTISGGSPWGFYPGAEDIGEKYGEGEYLLFRTKVGDESVLTSARTLRVVAEKRYRLADDDPA